MSILPATGADLPPLAQSGITQELKIENSQEGVKPLVVRMKVQYTVDGQAKSEVVTVNNFPASF